MHCKKNICGSVLLIRAYIPLDYMGNTKALTYGIKAQNHLTVFSDDWQIN